MAQPNGVIHLKPRPIATVDREQALLTAYRDQLRRELAEVESRIERSGATVR